MIELFFQSFFQMTLDVFSFLSLVLVGFLWGATNPFLKRAEINLFSFILSQNILLKTSHFSKRTAFQIEKQFMGISGGALVEGSACQ